MYYGEFSSNVDDKGRINVPKSFRAVMDLAKHRDWYLTRGFDNCVALYPHPVWEKIVAQMNGYSIMDARAIDFRRLFFGSVAETQVDGQGRLGIPLHLRDYAGLQSNPDGVLIGVVDHLELWSKDAWNGFQADHMANIKAMASDLFKGEAQPRLEGA